MKSVKTVVYILLYKTAQASSYDRASVRKDTATWFANWDRSQFLRTDSVQGRCEFVLLVPYARHCTVAPDYGRFKVLLNGKTIEKSVDFYKGKLRTLVIIRKAELSAGEKTLTFVQ